MNDDELTPRELDDMRDRLRSASHRIRPAGSHRTAFIATSIAVVLVAALAVSVLTLTSLLGNVRPAPVASPTPSSTPTPIHTSPPTSTPPTVVADGDCDAMLSESDLAAIVGDVIPRWYDLEIGDPAPVGGLSCGWGRDWREITLVAVPLAAVPTHLRAPNAAEPCEPQTDCTAHTIAGNVWIAVDGPEPDEQRRILDVVNERLAPGVPVVPPPPAPQRWTMPTCGNIRAVIADTFGVPEAGEYIGDNHPRGAIWDVETANGLVSWCYGQIGERTDTWGNLVAEAVEVWTSPGATPLSDEELARAGGTIIDLPGAQIAAFVPGGRQTSGALTASRIYASTGSNTVIVDSWLDDLDQARDQASALAERLIAVLDAG